MTAEGETPRLSVLVPSWNAASTIEWAIDSVIADRDASLECIVIDDGSTDGTPEIVSAISDRDPRVILLRLEVNEGVSHARNRGLAIARGEWIAFHDADDRMLPGWFDALMRPTTDPEVRVVIGQRIWTDGERRWLSPLYDIPDIRQPGRKSISTHPGLLYYASATGKVFHRSLLGDLRFEGRVLGDQAWTIRALLRADGHIEVVGETVFEWTRPRPEQPVETITTIARASAMGAVEMTHVARRVFGEVSAEIDEQIADEPTRTALKAAYFERLIRSDLGGPVAKAIERHDPATGALFDALAAFFEVVPTGDPGAIRPPHHRRSCGRPRGPGTTSSGRRAGRTGGWFVRRCVAIRGCRAGSPGGELEPVFMLVGVRGPDRTAGSPRPSCGPRPRRTGSSSTFASPECQMRRDRLRPRRGWYVLHSSTCSIPGWKSREKPCIAATRSELSPWRPCWSSPPPCPAEPPRRPPSV